VEYNVPQVLSREVIETATPQSATVPFYFIIAFKGKVSSIHSVYKIDYKIMFISIR